MPPPSAVRVFAKSLHILSLAWVVSVSFLWAAEVHQDARLTSAASFDPHWTTVLEGVAPGLAIEACAFAVGAWTEPTTPTALADTRREWIHAFWWSILPIALLLETVYVTIWIT